MKKLVALTGAGISAESGFATFRDAGGLWDQYPVEQVATPEGWEKGPTLVTEFYNKLRRQLAERGTSHLGGAGAGLGRDGGDAERRRLTRTGWFEPCHSPTWRLAQGVFVTQPERYTLHSDAPL